MSYNKFEFEKEIVGKFGQYAFDCLPNDLPTNFNECLFGDGPMQQDAKSYSSEAKQDSIEIKLKDKISEFQKQIEAKK